MLRYINVCTFLDNILAKIEHVYSLAYNRGKISVLITYFLKAGPNPQNIFLCGMGKRNLSNFKIQIIISRKYSLPYLFLLYSFTS